MTTPHNPFCSFDRRRALDWPSTSWSSTWKQFAGATGTASSAHTRLAQHAHQFAARGRRGCIHRWPFEKTVGPGKWNKPHLNQGPLFLLSKPTKKDCTVVPEDSSCSKLETSMAHPFQPQKGVFSITHVQARLRNLLPC